MRRHEDEGRKSKSSRKEWGINLCVTHDMIGSGGSKEKKRGMPEKKINNSNTEDNYNKNTN